jgi:hypothetical protein
VTIVRNKRDKEERDVSTEEGKAKAQKFSGKFFETLAKDGTNVKEAFSEVVQQLRRQNPSTDTTREGRTVMGSDSRRLQAGLGVLVSTDLIYTWLSRICGGRRK